MAADKSDGSSRSAFLALCLTCKTLLRATRPLLYAEVHLDRPTAEGCALTSTRQLARTLCAAPHLGLLIRKITSSPLLESWDQLYDVRDAVHGERDSADLLQFEKVLTSKLHSEADVASLAKAFATGFDEILGFRPDVLVVLMMSTQVESVAIHQVGVYWNSGREEMAVGVPLVMFWARKNLLHLPSDAFSHLTELKIDGLQLCEDYASVPMCKFMSPEGSLRAVPAVMGLSSLQRLEVSGVSWNMSHDKWPLAKGSSSIKSLDLLDCNLNSRTITALIETCSVLHEFSYAARSPRIQMERIGQGPFDYQVGTLALHAALSPHKATLRDLTIINLEDEGRLWDANDEFSLSGFHSLTSLEIDLQLLVGNQGQTNISTAVRSLPSTLRKLVIHVYSVSFPLEIFINELKTLQHRGLDRFEATLPPKDNWGGSTSDRQFFEIVYDHNSRYDPAFERYPVVLNVGDYRSCHRVIFRCRGLQQWSEEEVEALADAFRRRDVSSMEVLP
ncbi:uncharacterized protein MYCGRDRAFT_95586 [Zymoseptoria tritici IPO323]|uniref:F-box domain-containing protein n=1 Tax=Zymoseptoria tritici (strain CBS 115943 / IPO323) TaxID=336722 RepID=F9XJ59_ZYMTI|nr:uncharacterized protein MYCGRDRAFT_95586 [Zymoseptoria tritici IPO323]EGP84775.1 hypothetical protein MYCGRDRAFT_95586 [Zymoseptoria tritici IPO323]